MKFEPVVYEHAAAVISRSPWEVSRSFDLLTEAHASAYEIYRHSPITVGIDIYNPEAEAYGAVVCEPDENEVPSIPLPPFHDCAELCDLEPLAPLADGRIPMVLDTAKHLSELCKQATVRVPVSGPFSVACNLLGFEAVLCAAITDPDTLTKALTQIVLGQTAFCQEAGARGLAVTVFESAATPPLLSPELFRKIVMPVLQQLMRVASESNGSPAACIIGGDTNAILQYVIQTEPGHIICPAGTNQEQFLKAMTAYPDTTVRVNMNPGVFVGDDPDAARTEADRVMDLTRGLKNSLIGSGVLPYEANQEIVLSVKEYIETS